MLALGCCIPFVKGNLLLPLYGRAFLSGMHGDICTQQGSEPEACCFCVINHFRLINVCWQWLVRLLNTAEVCCGMLNKRLESEVNIFN